MEVVILVSVSTSLRKTHPDVKTIVPVPSVFPSVGAVGHPSGRQIGHESWTRDKRWYAGFTTDQIYPSVPSVDTDSYV